MTSITKTAYPRFKKFYKLQDLEKVFQVTETELQFIAKKARGKSQQLTLLTLLKSHQHLGYLPNLGSIPKSVWQYLSSQLGCDETVKLMERTETNKKSFYRYYQSIRNFLGIFAWSEKGQDIVYASVKKAAFTMSNPSDLINVAMESLIKQRYELPAFSTLSRMVGHIRQEVHLELFEKLNKTLKPEVRLILEALLQVGEEETITGFTKIKEKPGKPTLQLMHKWIKRLKWLQQILDTSRLFEIIAPTKVQQFAAEIEQAETQDLLDMNAPKRYTHLVCLIHQKQVATKDDLVDLFLRRMRRTKIGAEKKLAVLQELSRHIEEQLLGIFSKVADYTLTISKDKELGNSVRQLIQTNGGAANLLEKYKQVAAYHDKNYLPLLWNFHKNNRVAIFNLIELLGIKSCSEDNGLLNALSFIIAKRNARKDYLPCEISLDFMGEKWLSFVKAKENGVSVLKRRALEVAVSFHVADALKCADLYVPYSEKYADYRQQLLPWEDCQNLLDGYCESIGIPATANGFVAHLKTQLVDAAKKADEAYPKNSQFFIDEEGEPHLKKLKAKPLPQDLLRFETTIKEKMPQRDLLDLLKRVQTWIPYTRHFGPPSGSENKLNDDTLKYIFTIFGYGCNLGANQMAKHTEGLISSRSLRRINKQHISVTKIDAAIKDVINTYSHWDLTEFWGDGSEMIVDGTHIELIENNLLGAHHIRYGGYGGIAYKYLSDKYVALFSRFISCGVWEAIHILDGFLANQSAIQPDTVIGDTQGQSEPVFALSYLMGIELMPRMRNWNDVYFYRPNKTTSYEHIDALFKKTADFKRLKTHWKDIMQVVLSIHAGKVLPSMLLRKLGVKSRKNKLYQAFRALGQIVRTIFLLKYLTDPVMRSHINGATTKVESFHNFSDWITFAGRAIRTGDPVEQEKRVKYADLIANIVMLHNVVDLTAVLNEMNANGETITKELVERLSPYLTQHIRRFGKYYLDMNDLPEPLKETVLHFMQ